jgi:hypothetical protein
VTTFLCVASETSSAKPEILGALSAAFPLGLFLRRPTLLVLTALVGVSGLVWLAFGLEPPLHDGAIQSLVVAIWLAGTMLGFVLGRATRGTAWLLGIGVDDR